MQPLLQRFVATLVLALVSLTPGLCAGQAYSSCGQLVQGIECMIFEDNPGSWYVLDNIGTFQHGDVVLVEGTLDTSCTNFCFLPCITNNTIAICVTPPHFIRGDVNADGSVNIADPVAQLMWVFFGQALPCQDALDANDDGVVNIADAIHLLQFLFGQGPTMNGPHPNCGPDPTPDLVDCQSYPICP